MAGMKILFTSLVLVILTPFTVSAPALPSLILNPSLIQDLPSLNVSSTLPDDLHLLPAARDFPIPKSDFTLSFNQVGAALDPHAFRSLLIVAAAAIKEEIVDHGQDATSPDHDFTYDIGDGIELQIYNSPDVTDGPKWIELQSIVTGLQVYAVQRGRYQELDFDIYEFGYPFGWGTIKKSSETSFSNATISKRDSRFLSVQKSSPAASVLSVLNSSLLSLHAAPALELPPTSSSSTILNTSLLSSSTPLFPVSQFSLLNSSTLNLPTATIIFHVPDTHMTLRLTLRQIPLDPSAVRALLLVAIEAVSEAIGIYGETAMIPRQIPWRANNGRLRLDVINAQAMPGGVTWLQVAYVVLGLVEYIVDGEHYSKYLFTVYDGEPQVEVALGTIGVARMSDG